jgi:hypothetical protein
MFTKLKNFWKSLPHQVQAAITAGAGSFLVTAGHAWSEGGCVSVSCLKHYAATAASSAAGILYAFYMTPAKSPSAPTTNGNSTTKPDNVGKI